MPYHRGHLAVKRGRDIEKANVPACANRKVISFHVGGLVSRNLLRHVHCAIRNPSLPGAFGGIQANPDTTFGSGPLRSKLVQASWYYLKRFGSCGVDSQGAHVCELAWGTIEEVGWPQSTLCRVKQKKSIVCWSAANLSGRLSRWFRSAFDKANFHPW